MMIERDRSGTWRARRSPRTETSVSVRQRMALEDVQTKTVVLKCSACLRITGDPVIQVRVGLGRSQKNTVCAEESKWLYSVENKGIGAVESKWLYSVESKRICSVLSKCVACGSGRCAIERSQALRRGGMC
ncbi:hypothetical protein GN958_ATG13224 [Phytophthora infestans]|uniref:Uncharacterized protein n=1 Tax=Phytophthora infestans TaxID=4787 RepID=A0A8S9UF24_PHYIN|nr:hypothetical protein GN958_ATG13224 [Phytophthora infestans]